MQHRSNQLLDDFNFAVVTNHQSESNRFTVAACQFDIDADQAVLDTPVKIDNLALLPEDAVFDFGVADPSSVPDRGEGADITMLEHAIFADHRRPADDAILENAAFTDVDASRNSCDTVSGAEHGNVGHLVQYDAVGFQHIVFLSCIQPPAFKNMAVNMMSSFDQTLNGCGNLKLAPLACFDFIDRFMNHLVEQINAPQRQVRFWLGRLFFEANDATIGS